MWKNLPMKKEIIRATLKRRRPKPETKNMDGAAKTESVPDSENRRKIYEPHC